MQTRYSIDLDFCHDEDDVQDAILRVQEEHGGKVNGTVTDAEGPGGGWPVVRWTTFDRQVMLDLIMSYAAGDANDATNFALDVEQEHVL